MAWNGDNTIKLHYVYMQSEINIKVGNKATKAYFDQIKSQFEGNIKNVSGLSSHHDLIANLSLIAFQMKSEHGYDDYSDFLAIRRVLWRKN